jgi:hypothetical protein
VVDEIWGSRIDMTAGPTITPTHPSLCLYQYLRCCFVMLFQLSGFVGLSSKRVVFVCH